MMMFSFADNYRLYDAKSEFNRRDELMITPLISIIVPVYNTEKYLSNCIESLLRQTYTNLEIWLIDDGSTDRSLEICKQYASTDTRLKICHQENQGVGAARNSGMKCAHGDYICFVDSDDYVDNHYIEILYKDISSGDYDFSFIDYEKVDDFQYKPFSEVQNRFTFTQKELMEALFNRMAKTSHVFSEVQFIIVTNKMYRKSVLKDIWFTNMCNSEDLLFNNQVFMKCRKAIGNDAKLYMYYQRENSATHVPVNQNYSNRLLPLVNCLKAIPVEQKAYRAGCLIRLYKKILLTRYLMRHKSNKKDLDALLKNIETDTFSEMLLNKYIPIKMRSILGLCYKLPFAYSFYVWSCDMKSKYHSK